MLLLSLPASLPTAPTRSSPVGVSAFSVGSPFSSADSSAGVSSFNLSSASSAAPIKPLFGSTCSPFSFSTVSGLVIEDIPCLTASPSVSCEGFLNFLSYPFLASKPPAPRRTAPARPPAAKPNVMVPATIAAFVPIFLSISSLASGLAFTNALPVLSAFFAKYPPARTAAPANNPPDASAIPVPRPSATFAANPAILPALPSPLSAAFPNPAIFARTDLNLFCFVSSESSVSDESSLVSSVDSSLSSEACASSAFSTFSALSAFSTFSAFSAFSAFSTFSAFSAFSVVAAVVAVSAFSAFSTFSATSALSAVSAVSDVSAGLLEAASSSAAALTTFADALLL